LEKIIELTESKQNARLHLALTHSSSYYGKNYQQ